MPISLSRLPVGQVASTRKPRSLALLFLFVAIGCTNLACPVGAASEGAGTAPQPAPTPIASINDSMATREITVQAAISNVRPPAPERAQYTVTLTQDGATIPLMFKTAFQPQLAPKVKVGNVITAKALVSRYRGHLELRLQDPANLEVVGAAGATSSEPAKTTTESPAPAPVSGSTSAPAATPTVAGKMALIGDIKEDWADQVVTISGTIAGSESTGNGQRLHVQDRTGEIRVVLWQNLLAGLAATEFQPGRVITVTGPVQMYRGTLEIVPEAAGDVKLAPQ